MYDKLKNTPIQSFPNLENINSVMERFYVEFTLNPGCDMQILAWKCIAWSQNFFSLPCISGKLKDPDYENLVQVLHHRKKVKLTHRSNRHPVHKKTEEPLILEKDDKFKEEGISYAAFKSNYSELDVLVDHYNKLYAQLRDGTWLESHFAS